MRRGAALASVCAVAGLASCGGDSDSAGTGDLSWAGQPRVTASPDVPGVRIVTGRVRNDSLRRLRLSARDLGRRGFDRDTGFGLLDIGEALSRKPTPRDPGEPNDDIRWVDGHSFRTPSPLTYRGKGTVRLRALLDVYEDPVDVYRVRVRARSRVTVVARPAFGDPVLFGFAPGTRSVRSTPVDRSRRRGSRKERITLHNRSSGRRTFFAALGVQRNARSLDAGYRLTIRR